MVISEDILDWLGVRRDHSSWAVVQVRGGDQTLLGVTALSMDVVLSPFLSRCAPLRVWLARSRSGRRCTSVASSAWLLRSPRGPNSRRWRVVGHDMVLPKQGRTLACAVYTPWPVSTCVILYVSGSPPRSLQASQFGRTAPTAWWGRTVSSAASWMRHPSQVSSLASSRTSRNDWLVEGVSLPEHRPRRWWYTRRSARACSSNGGDAANTDADAWDIIRYPLTIRMMVVLCNHFSSSKLRRLLGRSSAHTGTPYRILDRTTLVQSKNFDSGPADVW